MIYEFPAATEPVRQGDIFAGLPRVEVSLKTLAIADDQGSAQVEWSDVVKEQKPVTALLPVQPVVAIVVTQDCDAIRAPDITLCEVRLFREVERKAKDTKSAKSWQSILTQQARLNLKWFYLPPDVGIGFADKMAVDFRATLRVPGPQLEDLRFLRKGRLNPEADEHFRERLADFYRRYPYDEWYPLNVEEFESYRADHPDAEPRPWQRKS